MNTYQVNILIKTPAGYKNIYEKGIVFCKKRTPLKLIQEKAVELVKQGYSNYQTIDSLEFEAGKVKKLSYSFILNMYNGKA